MFGFFGAHDCWGRVLKSTQDRLRFALPVLFMLNLSVSSQDFDITASSFLGSFSDNEAIVAVGIQSDGTIVLGANTALASAGGKSAQVVNGASSSSIGTIIRLSINGQSVKSMTKVGAPILDLCVGGNDNIFVAQGEAGAHKLDKQAGVVLWQEDLFAHRIDACMGTVVGN